MYNPNLTRVCLLNVPLENDYKHTLWFDGETQAKKIENQSKYFLSKKKLEFTELTYQRKDNSIKVPKQYDELLGCNYVMYQNGMYNSKWFYAFITDIKYISDGVTEIFVETDVIQTWLTDYVVKTSFVEREHSYYDNIGENTYPEQVELGEFTTFNQIDLGMSGAHCVVATTWDYQRDTQGGSMIQGIYHGVNYYLMRDEQALVYFLGMYADGEEGKSDSITGIFMVPDSLTGYDTLSTHNDVEPHWDWLSESNGLSYFGVKKLPITDGSFPDFTIFKPQNYEKTDGTPSQLPYIPRNKKLYTYPYHFLECTNNNGGSAIYRYEDFKNPDNNLHCVFKTNGSITPGCSIRTIPLYYHNVDYNFEEGLNLGKFPVCSYSTDMYTNWLTQNGANIATNLIMGGANFAIGGAMMATGAGAFTGGMIGLSGLSQISSTLSEVSKMSKVPPQAEGNLNCGDIVFSQGRCTFSFYQKCIKPEYMKVIDGYFDMFGYKTCYVKVPYTNHRERYWYTKTIDVNIDGAIPNKDLQKIKDAYNNGITFWKNPSDIGNYPYYQNGTLYYSNNVTH